MKRFDAHIRSVDAPLQQAPEVLKAVRMDSPIDVLNRMIYDLMNEVRFQAAIGHERIRVECRASLHMLLDFGVEFLLLAAADDLRAHVAAPLKQTHDGCLILSAGASDAALTLALMHVAGLAADERLIGLNFAAQLDRSEVPHLALKYPRPVQFRPEGSFCKWLILGL